MRILRFCNLLCSPLLVWMIFGFANPASSNPDPGKVYGDIVSELYLSGHFNPAQHKSFVELRSIGLEVSRPGLYLRREAATALHEMEQAFHRDHPQIEWRVISATRNWSDQSAIWGAKWSGKRLVDGAKLNLRYRDPIERGRVILRYSSMPGTSRHHWGSDLDLNSLENSYFEGGNGAILYHWLRQHASEYGFCQPYSAGRQRGYNEEKWHWSYRPLASIFLADWRTSFEKKPEQLNAKGKFPGSESVINMAPEYVISIDQSCL